MTYLELINAFWHKDLEYNFSDKEIALYFYFLKVSNSIGWKNPFGLSNAMTVAKFGWGKTSFDTAKNNLKRAGLIEFKAGDGRGNTYQYEIVGLEKEIEKGIQKHTLSTNLSNPKPETSIDIDKDKTKNKEKEKKKDFLFPYSSENFLIVWTALTEMPKWKNKVHHSLQLALNNLGKYEEEFAIELIEKSIEGNWQGVTFTNTPEEYEKWKKRKGGNNAHQQGTGTGNKTNQRNYGAK